MGYGARPLTDLLQLGSRKVSGREEYQPFNFSSSPRPSSAEAMKFAFKNWEARSVLRIRVSKIESSPANDQGALLRVNTY